MKALRLSRVCFVLFLAAVPNIAQDNGNSPPPEPVAVASETVVATERGGESSTAPGELFIAANRAYDEGDFAAAVRLYNALIAAGNDSGQIHYNLGNAYLRNGELGHAIASFRRGRRHLPRNEDIRANLAFARSSARDAIAPPEPSAVLSTLLFWHYGLSVAELAALAIVVSFLFWGVAIARLFKRSSEALRWLFVLLLVLLTALGGSLFVHRALPTTVAVIVPQEIEAHTAPDVDSVVRFKLHAGTEVRIRDEREGWLRIALPDGQQGWIEAVWTDVVDS